jgi:hypothetical protein
MRLPKRGSLPETSKRGVRHPAATWQPPGRHLISVSRRHRRIRTVQQLTRMPPLDGLDMGQVQSQWLPVEPLYPRKRLVCCTQHTRTSARIPLCWSDSLFPNILSTPRAESVNLRQTPAPQFPPEPSTYTVTLLLVLVLEDNDQGPSLMRVTSRSRRSRRRCRRSRRCRRRCVGAVGGRPDTARAPARR